jgi:hypothetical protein
MVHALRRLRISIPESAMLVTLVETPPLLQCVRDELLDRVVDVFHDQFRYQMLHTRSPLSHPSRQCEGQGACARSDRDYLSESARKLPQLFFGLLEKHDIEHQIRFPFILGNVRGGWLKYFHFACLERFLVCLAIGPYARKRSALQRPHDSKWAGNIRGCIPGPEGNFDYASLVVLKDLLYYRLSLFRFRRRRRFRILCFVLRKCWMYGTTCQNKGRNYEPHEKTKQMFHDTPCVLPVA